MRVQRIPSRYECKKKRVAAYCRVSTRDASQEESFETQLAYYTQYIKGNPDWVFVRIYADHGVSGVSTRKRPEFLEMIHDALAGKIDLILVKSISRFSRNLVDCQNYIAQLKDKGVEVRFEREGISSFDPTSGFIFSLLSAVAQDESRSISENIKWGYKKRFERGEYCLGSNRILGYDKDPMTKKLVPNKDAWIVRLAFERFVQGVTYRRCLCHQSVFFGAASFRDGLYDTSYKIYADYELEHRLLANNVKFVHVDSIICDYEGGGFSTKIENRKALHDEEKRVLKKYASKGELIRRKVKSIMTLQKLRVLMVSDKSPTFIRSCYVKISNTLNR